MPIEIRELIIRARVEPDGDAAGPQSVVRPATARGGAKGIDEDTLARILADMKER